VANYIIEVQSESKNRRYYRGG